jgi:hypothetical protein
MTRTKKRNNTYEAWGMTAILPGMVRAVETLQAEIDQIRESLAALQTGAEPAQRKKPHAYWDSLTPEERSAEMKRRFALSRKRQHAKSALSTSGLKRGTKAYREADAAIKRVARAAARANRKPTNAAQTRWDRMTHTERKNFLSKMAAGRAAQAKAKAAQVNGEAHP